MLSWFLANEKKKRTRPRRFARRQPWIRRQGTVARFIRYRLDGTVGAKTHRNNKMDTILCEHVSMTLQGCSSGLVGTAFGPQGKPVSRPEADIDMNPDTGPIEVYPRTRTATRYRRTFENRESVMDILCATRPNLGKIFGMCCVSSRVRMYPWVLCFDLRAGVTGMCD